MKASRAYITGLGTTGVLLCFALLLLVVVGAIVAFHGWPAGTAGNDSTAAVRIGSGSSTRAAFVRREAAARRAAQAGTARSASRGKKRRARERGSVHGVSQNGTQAPAQDQAAPAKAAAPTAPARRPQGAPKAPQGPDVGQVSNGVADTTRQVTQGAAGALGDLGLAPLDQTVSHTGQALSDLVQQTGDTPQRALPRLR